jgi:hypothetical protein
MQARLVLMFDSGLQVLRGSKTSYDVLRDTKTSQFHPIIPDDLIPEKARSHLTLTTLTSHLTVTDHMPPGKLFFVDWDGERFIMH